MNLIRLEFLKLKQSKIYLPLIGLPLFAVIFGSINFSYNQAILQREWVSLWTQVFLFYGSFFYPFVVVLCLAFIWRQEHRHHGIRLLLSAAYSEGQIILAKIMTAFIVICLSQLWFILLYFSAGSLFNFESAMPLGIAGWLGWVTLFSVVMMCIQSYLSLRFDSFAIPVAISLATGILSFFLASQQRIEILSYLFVSAKLSLAMNNQYPNIDVSGAEWFKMIATSLLIFVLFYYLQIAYFRKLRK